MIRDQKIENIKKSVHLPLNFLDYNGTNVRDNTNCYSHALGSTLPFLELYRIGSISGKKGIDERYKSIEEIKSLLIADCKTIDLKIEESSEEDELLENQYKIELFVAINNKGEIWDYHFLRFENGIWTEKWKRKSVQTFYKNDISKYKSFPWHLVGYYKITR